MEFPAAGMRFGPPNSLGLTDLPTRQCGEVKVSGRICSRSFCSYIADPENLSCNGATATSGCRLTAFGSREYPGGDILPDKGWLAPTRHNQRRLDAAGMLFERVEKRYRSRSAFFRYLSCPPSAGRGGKRVVAYAVHGSSRWSKVHMIAGLSGAVVCFRYGD